MPAAELAAENTPEISTTSLRGLSGIGPWPYAATKDLELPRTLPGGACWPKISVVTPTYNQGAYIEQTILSLINQNYPNLELIVIDGGSTDSTVQLIRKYEHCIAYWVSEKDTGQSNAINKGMAKATGDILTWLNSDDMLAQGALASVAMAFHTSGADMVAGICQLHANGNIYDQHLTSCEDGPLLLPELLDLENSWMQGQFFYQPEVFFSRNLWQKAGGYVNEDLYYSMDYELWLRMAKVGANLKVIGRPIAIYRVHEEQKTFETGKFLPELKSVAEAFLATTLGGELQPPISYKDRLKIVSLNDIGFKYGAGIAQMRIAASLASAGHILVPLCLAHDNLPDGENETRLIQAAINKLREISPDVVLIGNIHGAMVGSSLVHQIADEWPAIFIMHDLWFISGRCAYFGECRNFLSGCDDSCPTYDQYPALEPQKIRTAWDSKTSLLFQCRRLALAADSKWVLECLERRIAAQSRLLDEGPERGVIRYGLPTGLFNRRDKSLCREILNLPQDKFLILFSCSEISDHRKGASHLVHALKALDLTDCACVLMGHINEGSNLELPELIEFGYNNNQWRQVLLFSAVDVFVGPSLEEAFGQVFIEAAACGTPSIGYPVGGVPEALKDGICGLVADDASPASLARAISRIYHDPAMRRDMGAWGRIYIESEFSYARSAHSMMHLIRRHLGNHGIRLAPKLSLSPGDPSLDTPFCLFDSKTTEVSSILDKSRLASEGFSRSGVSASMQEIRACALVLLRFYEDRFRITRKRKAPWYFSTRAWRLRRFRNQLRLMIGKYL